MQLDNNSSFLIKTLENSGFSAFAVGGCVRDSLMGREVTDYDITTSAKPNEIKKVFSSFNVIETGIKHGTVTVIVDKKAYEITTFRVDLGYSDNRRPDNVEFVSDLTLDLSRRDFTVNAIAFSETFGFVDPFNGKEDIKKRIIRAVGDPFKRFSEDALRILRALRFASVLGFEIENETSKAIFSLSESLLNVSPERKFSELKKLINGVNAKEILERYKNALASVLPIKGDLSKLNELPENSSMRFACICGNESVGILEKLRADNETKRVAELLVNSKPIPENTYEIKKFISSYGREYSRIIADYRRVMFGEDLNNEVERILNSSDCLFISELAVNGDDLLNFGMSGSTIRKTLHFLLDLVLKNEVENKKELLIQTLKDIDNQAI